MASASASPRTPGAPTAEDRIRNAKDTGLTNLPLHGFDQNQIWCEIVALAADPRWLGARDVPQLGHALDESGPLR